MIRFDSASLISGRIVFSAYPGHGLPGADIPSGGTDGDSPLFETYDAAGSGAADEWRWEITSWPSDGTLVPFEDGSFTFEADDGSYSFECDVYRNGVVVASHTVVLNVGVLTAQADCAQGYTVFGAASADLAQGYTVISAVTQDLAQGYTVIAAVTQDLAQGYTVIGSVTSDFAQGYTVFGEASADLTQGYSVIASVTADFEQGYEVEAEGTVTADFPQSYSVTGTVTADFEQGYTVIASVSDDFEQDYEVLDSVTADFEQGYEVEASSGGGGDCPSVADIWQRVIEDGMTAEQILRVILAAVSGQTTGAGTSTEHFKSKDGSKDRIQTVFDGQGNRAAVTLDGS